MLLHRAKPKKKEWLAVIVCGLLYHSYFDIIIIVFDCFLYEETSIYTNFVGFSTRKRLRISWVFYIISYRRHISTNESGTHNSLADMVPIPKTSVVPLRHDYKISLYYAVGMTNNCVTCVSCVL